MVEWLSMVNCEGTAADSAQQLIWALCAETELTVVELLHIVVSTASSRWRRYTGFYGFQLNRIRGQTGQRYSPPLNPLNYWWVLPFLCLTSPFSSSLSTNTVMDFFFFQLSDERTQWQSFRDEKWDRVEEVGKQRERVFLSESQADRVWSVIPKHLATSLWLSSIHPWHHPDKTSKRTPHCWPNFAY